MSTLRSALDELAGVDLGSLRDEELASELSEIERASRVIEAERSRRLVEAERRGSFAEDGSASIVAWHAERSAITRSAAMARVRMARALEHMPLTERALGSGELSTQSAGVLVRAREAAPEAFERAEEHLVQAARTLRVEELRGVKDRWLAATDAMASAEQGQRRLDRRHLHVTPALDGMVRVDGELDPETGQTVLSALRAVMDTEARSGAPDRRSWPQRRADALGQVCRAWLDRSDRPAVGGERPHVVVIVDLESLEGRTGGRCELSDVGPIMPEAARRWACDAAVSRVITSGQSEPLEVGRKTKVVPPPLRRAVAVRDRGCRFPACDRPPGWCDAHHVRHWADGGETGLSNLVMLCRAHHRAVHAGRFHVAMVEGGPVFARPDGSVLGDRAPP